MSPEKLEHYLALIEHERESRPAEAALADEIKRLRAELERAHDARIEAQNPGIDMDEVRADRARRRG